MLNVTCPNCQKGMTLSKPKTGKFAPTCKGCNSRFQLLIKESEDGKFRFKTAPMRNPPTDAVKSKSVTPRDGTKVALGAETAVPDKNDSAKASKGSEKRAQQAPANPTVVAQSESAGRLKYHSGSRNDEGGHRQRVIGAPPSGRLGPYRLISLLGEGGMGSVYLANQTTLDRNVALKVVKSNLSKNKSMLARFTREAYAAAQLVHPNVVQIYDMGDDRGNCYFSMELVDGQSLLELVQKRKRLDPEQATSFILHAARGLQCAHNAGMVHRDIKPANLLVNNDGLVKVADLGLVKVPDKEEIEADVDEAAALSASQDLTRAGSALGTPYYMAPEQSRSSINVDHRADIYSLGCTYYVLLTGKKPFEANSVEELVSKHTSAPLVVPSRIVERVPEEVSNIVAKMMEKRPEDRYQSMEELIADLEKNLGLSSTEAFTPDETDADTLEQCVASFYGNSQAKLRDLLPLAMIAGSLLLAFVMLFVSWKFATGFVLLPIAAFVSYFLISGSKESPILFVKTRELVIRSGWLSWLKWAAAAMLLVVASFMVGSFVHWMILAALGVGLGAAYYFLVDLPIAKSRHQSVVDSEKLARKMRLKGMDETTVQMFVAKYSGNQWEELFENLFGYEAKRRIRDEISKSELGKKKPKFRAWRDSIADGLQARIESISNEQDQKHLQKIETAGLVEQGVSAVDAKEQAAQMALALVDHGDSLRVAALENRIAELDPEVQREKQRNKVKSMLAEARSGKYRKPPSLMKRATLILNRLLGAYPRFLFGCCLIVGCLMWANQNELFSVEELKQTAVNAANSIANDDTKGASVAGGDTATIAARLNIETEPLAFPILGKLFFNFNSLIAGLILVSSAVVFGWRMAIFVLPAAFVTLWGESIGVPRLIEVNHLHTLSAVIGVGLLVVGILFGRSEK